MEAALQFSHMILPSEMEENRSPWPILLRIEHYNNLDIQRQRFIILGWHGIANFNIQRQRFIILGWHGIANFSTK